MKVLLILCDVFYSQCSKLKQIKQTPVLVLNGYYTFS